MDFNSLKNEINKRIEEYNLPYFDIVVMQNHKTIFQYGFNEGKAVDGNEKLTMFSMSKPITSLAAVNLIKEGKLSLSDKVSKYFPEYENIKVLQANGEYLPAKNELTIEHCLSMRGGFDYTLNKETILEVAKKNPNAPLSDFAFALSGQGLDFEPGTNYQYSLSFDLIGAIIEKVTGVKFSKYIKETIFDKLGMNSSTFENHKNDCDSYLVERRLVDGEWKIVNRWYEGFLFSDVYECAGAGLISTINDYVLFADALACGGVTKDNIKVASLETIEEMRRPRSENIKPYGAYIGTSCDDYGYGLGVRVRKETNEFGIPAGEFGWDGACGCYSLIDTKNKISIVMGLSIQSWPDSLRGLHLALANIVYKHLLK